MAPPDAPRTRNPAPQGAHPATPEAPPAHPELGAAGELVTITEAGRRAGVSRQALSRRIKRGTLKSVRVEVSGEVQVRVALDELLRVYPEADATSVEEGGAHPAPQPATLEVAHPAPLVAYPEPTPGLAPLDRETITKAMTVVDKGQRQALVRVEEKLLRSRRRERRLGVTLFVTIGLAAGGVALAWSSFGRAVRAEDRASTLEERAIGAEVTAGIAQASALRLEADVAELEQTTTQLEQRASQAEAEALTASQERDAARERLAAIERAAVLERALAIGRTAASVLRRAFGL